MPVYFEALFERGPWAIEGKGSCLTKRSSDKRIRRRLTSLRLGDGSELEQPPDKVIVKALQEHARQLSPQWAVTLMRAPLNYSCTSFRMCMSMRQTVAFLDVRLAAGLLAAGEVRSG